MRWDRLFEDLEDQLDSEWEAERAALDSEAERLRLSKVTLRERLIAVIHADAVSLELRDSSVLKGEIVAVGADFVALRPEHAPSGRISSLIVAPARAIVMASLSYEDLLRSARAPSAQRSALADRITLGFVLRDAARRRRGVRVAVASGAVHAGTIDRVGVDHLDLALHDSSAPRRASEVRGHRLVSFEGVLWVSIEDAGGSEIL